MVSNGLVEVFENTKTTIIALESMAGQGTSLGSSLEELARIIEEVPKKFHSRIGVCLDTCHLFAAGYRLDTQTTYQEFWKGFDTIVGRDYLKIIHINDSKKEFNSHVDRHEEIEKGLIPKNVFIQLMNDTSLVDIPKILETPKTSLDDDARNIKRLLSYI
jgi:apurinic endonuclease APN1